MKQEEDKDTRILKIFSPPSPVTRAPLYLKVKSLLKQYVLYSTQIYIKKLIKVLVFVQVIFTLSIGVAVSLKQFTLFIDEWFSVRSKDRDVAIGTTNSATTFQIPSSKMRTRISNGYAPSA